MLNGLDPIIIFQFKNLLPGVSEALSQIPLINQSKTLIDAPPIPIYLSENLTGLFIDAESKNIDASTQTETKTDGSELDVNQKGVSSVVSVDILANKNSIGLTLLSAMSDLVFDKLTSKEYSITYLHGATTVFGGLLHSFSVSQNANDDLLRIKLELSRGPVRVPEATQTVPTVPKTSGTVPL